MAASVELLGRELTAATKSWIGERRCLPGMRPGPSEPGRMIPSQRSSNCDDFTVSAGDLFKQPRQATDNPSEFTAHTSWI